MVSYTSFGCASDTYRTLPQHPGLLRVACRFCNRHFCVTLLLVPLISPGSERGVTCYSGYNVEHIVATYFCSGYFTAPEVTAGLGLQVICYYESII